MTCRFGREEVAAVNLESKPRATTLFVLAFEK